MAALYKIFEVFFPAFFPGGPSLRRADYLLVGLYLLENIQYYFILAMSFRQSSGISSTVVPKERAKSSRVTL
jgi:hypothetical protein